MANSRFRYFCRYCGACRIRNPMSFLLYISKSNSKPVPFSFSNTSFSNLSFSSLILPSTDHALTQQWRTLLFVHYLVTDLVLLYSLESTLLRNTVDDFIREWVVQELRYPSNIGGQILRCIMYCQSYSQEDFCRD